MLHFSRHISKFVSEQKPKRRPPTKTIFPKRYNNVGNSPLSTPVHQRSQATTIEFSFEELKSIQAENNFGQNLLVNEASNGVNEISNRCNGVANRLSSSLFVSSSEKNQQQNQSVDLRNRINEIRGKQSPVLIDLTLDNDSDDSKNLRNYRTACQQNNQFAESSSPPITPKKPEKVVPYQHQKDAQPTSAPQPSYVQTPLLTNNPSQPNIQFSRMKVQPKYGVNTERKSANDRLVNARQQLPVIDLTKQTNVSRLFE